MSTIQQVAQKAGVSPTTVSHVINQTRKVSEHTRLRVLQAMEELGYRPNALARSLRRGKTHTIGLITPDSANPFFAEVGRAIEEAAFRQDYNVILCNTETDPERESIYIQLLTEKQVDGIVFVGSGGQTGSLRSLFEQSVPVVLVDRDLLEFDFDVVIGDHFQGGYIATRHLIKKGHRRIGCIAGPAHLVPSGQRLRGYRKALEEAHIHFDMSLVRSGDFRPHSGKVAAEELLSLEEPPTALFVFNDLMSIGAMAAAAELGFRIPDDLAIVGFDDIELASYTQPGLTTVRQPKAEIGHKAIELLLARMADKTRPFQRELLPTSLIIRQSCGGPE